MTKLEWNNKEESLLFFDENNKPVYSSIEILDNYQVVKVFEYGEISNNINMFIKGDNVISLYKLQKDFKSRIKCIYIDPPFNTGKTFHHYENARSEDTRLNSSHGSISYAVFCLKKKKSHCNH